MEYYSITRKEAMSFAEKLDGTRDYTLGRLAGQKILRSASLHSPSTESTMHDIMASFYSGARSSYLNKLFTHLNISSAPRVHS